MWYLEIINQQDYEKSHFYEGHRFHREVIEPLQVLIENVLVWKKNRTAADNICHCDTFRWWSVLVTSDGYAKFNNELVEKE